MIKFYVYLTIALLFSINLSVVNAQIYNYPIQPGSEQWKKLKTHAEMVNANQLPLDYLKINTIDLFKTCLNYPLLMDMFAYNNFKTGFKKMSSEFNGFNEFYKREDAAKVALAYYVSIKPESIITMKNLVEQGKQTFLISTLEILLADSLIISKLNNHEKGKLRDAAINSIHQKERYKNVYGDVGLMTSVYIAANSLTSLNDSNWRNHLQANEKAKKFTTDLILTDRDFLSSIKTFITNLKE